MHAIKSYLKKDENVINLISLAIMPIYYMFAKNGIELASNNDYKGAILNITFGLTFGMFALSLNLAVSFVRIYDNSYKFRNEIVKGMFCLSFFLFPIITSQVTRDILNHPMLYAIPLVFVVCLFKSLKY